tara:strand:- start:3800 stop:5578 length:1779 start_codon:yes stop_codon:yes gene_type:complete
MSQTTVKVQLQQRYDTAANWTSANPTLLAGEIGYESNTSKFKIGDGNTQWSSLAYAPGSGGYTAGTGVSISASNVISASAVALSQVFTAVNQTAHLALTTQEGDIVVRSDENKSYVRNSGSASDMTDYTLLATPTDAVLSINGQTGAITADQLAAAIESATDSNTFTDADHTKLNAIEASATADQTGAEIKTAYEAESDTNAYTDAEKTKLAGIEASATGDQTGAEIKTAYEAEADTNAYTDAEKTKLSGVATSANNYSHPTTAGNVHVPTGGSAGQFLKYSSSGTAVWAADNDTTYSVGDGGLTTNDFTNADHTKLDGIAASANNYAISTDLLDEDNFATNSATKVPSQQSVKAYVDTADALKANLSGATFTGAIAGPSATFTDDGATGAVVSIQGDDAQQWGFHIGNSTYHNSQASGLKSYIQDDGDLELAHYANAEYRNWWISQHDGTTGRYNIYCTAAGSIYLYNAGTAKLNTTTAGITVTGSVTDSTGELRTIVQNTQAGAYTLVAADAGKHILASGNITVPDSVFSAGQAITVVNNTGGDLTITKGTNMYNIADASNANRTLGTRGVCTLLFTAADTCYISGSPLS